LLFSSQQRQHHEAVLKRVFGSPLADGASDAGNTRDGYGVKLFEDGVLYAGDFEEGLRSGRGVQRWPDGHVYIGQWKRGKREGQGEYRFSHGDRDGSGVIEDNECDIYRGEWLDDMFHGMGVYTFADGDVYVGQFCKNEKLPLHHLRSEHEACLRRLHGSPLPAGHTAMGDTCDGYGVKLFQNGTIYAGDFKGGLRCGRGVQRWADGHVFVGEWKDDARHCGEYRFSYGDKNGSGVIEDEECDRYIGEFSRDSMHGKGDACIHVVLGPYDLSATPVLFQAFITTPMATCTTASLSTAKWTGWECIARPMAASSQAQLARVCFHHLQPNVSTLQAPLAAAKSPASHPPPPPPPPPLHPTKRPLPSSPYPSPGSSTAGPPTLRAVRAAVAACSFPRVTVTTGNSSMGAGAGVGCTRVRAATCMTANGRTTQGRVKVC
jgi:hypothetical protein